MMASLRDAPTYEVQVMRDDGHVHVLWFDDYAFREGWVNDAVVAMVRDSDIDMPLRAGCALAIQARRVYEATR